MSDFKTCFPLLDDSNHRLTSPSTSDYNCIAWAAEEDDRWWWPSPIGLGYWPPSVPRVESCDAFLRAFETLGYVQCDNSELEDGFVKVALYVSDAGKPTHMARQLTDGTWTSKLGQSNDINHITAEVISGPAYGNVGFFLKKEK